MWLLCLSFSGWIAALMRHCAWLMLLHTPGRRNFEDKVASVQKDAKKLAREKADSTNRKLRASVLKTVDAMVQSLDALLAKSAAEAPCQATL